MNGKRTFITFLLMTLMLTFVMSNSALAATTSTDTISISADPNYSLYYNSANGKMYKDQAMTSIYTDQAGKWSSAYDSKTQTYILTLNNFKFVTSAPIGLSLPNNTVIQLQSGTTNEISSYVFSGISSNSYGIQASKNLTICSTGDGSGNLSVYSGTSYTFDGFHSCGLRVEENFQLVNGHIFIGGGGDTNCNGMEVVSMDFYNGELATDGNNRGLCFIESQTDSNYLAFTTGTAIYGGNRYGGNDYVSRNLLDIESNDPDIAEQTNYDSLYIINTYPDVVYNAWYAEPVFYLIENDIVTGYPNDDNITFNINPGKNITRAEFVTILARLFESETDLEQYAGEYTFTDVPEWASKYVGWATKYDYVNGFDNSHFGSTENITREQMATILYRIVAKMELTSNTNKSAISFTDGAQIADFAKDAVTAMQKAGVINGYSNDNGTYQFKPKGQATRAEAFTMIYNFIKAYSK